MISETISHYRLLEKLGAGGMGDVYLAEDTRLGRKVALKVLPASFQYDPSRRERFLQEARAASVLRSPNVVSIYDIGEHEQTMFIAMEYVEGDLLTNSLENGPLDVYEAIDIAIQVAEALEEAHSLGIVHRDIKSSNLIVTDRGTVKVLDFGLAKIFSRPGEDKGHDKGDDDRTEPLGQQTAPGVILGTVSSMSPEQARGQNVDGRTDLFSLGVLLYEMLTGRQPFEGISTGDLLVSILHSEPPMLNQFAGDFSPELQWVISKALRKDRELRYQTARDFIVDLKNLGHGMRTQTIAAVNERAIQNDNNSRLPAHDATPKKNSSPRSRRRKPVDSIAILPMVNLSSDPELEYLSDGITENLINTLSRIPKLKVMARSTVFRYKGREVDAQGVRHELSVRAVMTGRLRQVGDRFLISAELVDTFDGAQLWGEQYTRSRSDVFTLQDEISNEISEKLRLKLTSGERRRVAKRVTENTDAHELYLKGRFQWNKWSEEGLRSAMSLYEDALKKDPNFALAYAGMGEACGVLAYFTKDAALSQAAMMNSKAFANRAVELDESLPEAHLLLANIHHFNEWEFAKAESEFKLALELNPNLASAHSGYAIYLMNQRRFPEALNEIELALQLDPLSLPVNASASYLLFNAEHYFEAMGQLHRTLELDSEFQLAHQLLGACLEHEGRDAEAVEQYLTAIKQSASFAEIAAVLREAFASGGIQGFWQRYVDFVDVLVEQRVITAVFAANVCLPAGEFDRAFVWLEKAFGEHSPALTHVVADPRYEPIQEDSRFRYLVGRIGLVVCDGGSTVEARG